MQKVINILFYLIVAVAIGLFILPDQLVTIYYFLVGFWFRILQEKGYLW